MKRIRRAVSGLLLGALLFLPVSAGSAAHTDTFTHQTLQNGQKRAVAMPAVYAVEQVVTARSLGMTEDDGAWMDADSDADGNTYVLTESGRVICFDAAFRRKQVYTLRDAAGGETDISGAGGLYVCGAGQFYVADTENARVLYAEDGTVRREITLPESDLIPQDFVFQPTRVARDSKGYLYVISNGSYYGALLYAPDGSFAGFYGANSVEGNVLTTLADLWERLTVNDEKRARMKKTLPYQFTDICLDDRDFVYTCTAKTGSEHTGQIRMLNPGGSNILPGADSFSFGEPDTVERYGKVVEQSFNGIAVDGDGFIYALDESFGLVYIYDSDRNMLAAFGGGRGQGTQAGVFSQACALTVTGSRVMVLDTLRGSVTVFARTAFGQALLAADRQMLSDDCLAAKPLWEEVRKQDPLNRLALQGLGRAALSEGDCEAAMAYARQANDADTYSRALTKVQNAFVSRHFVWLFFGAAGLIAGAVWLLVLSRKKQLVLIRSEKCRLMAGCCCHPFRNFQEIKEKKLGSPMIAAVLTVLYFLTDAVRVTMSDFRYTAFDASTYNVLFQLAQTVGLILLWSVANWAISTLQEGKGRLGEVCIVTAYSLLPLILYNMVSTGLSHVIAGADSAVMSGLYVIACLLTGITLCIGLMTVHEFGLIKCLLTAALTGIMMLLIVFVLFMVTMLLSQLVSFAGSVLLELSRLRR